MTNAQANKTIPYLPSIKVIGLGGGGSNAIDRMLDFGLRGVEFIAANTDKQALVNSLASQSIQLGPRLTRGLGAGGRPEIGRKAAEESYREIAQALEGADMVFLTAGMGGGTGTGSIPVVAKIARKLEILTIAVVTTPFAFEGGVRKKNASEGLLQLQPHVDTLITIPNQRLLDAVPRQTTFLEAFHLADDVLRQAVQSIVELITEPGTINVDFAHIQRLIRLGGGSLMSIGQGNGAHKAIKAVQQALYHPLLEDVSLENASGMIVNFSAGQDLTLSEVGEALAFIQEQASGNLELIFGTTNKDDLVNRVQANLVVTGLGAITLQDAFSTVGKKQENKLPANHPIPLNQEPLPENRVQKTTLSHAAVETKNLDVPAFMRRGLTLSTK
ncbi:MAG: Cell division protein FtsZ [Chloroflexi bacterium]|nr:Cell division protein FtsZ [Chloroflexota bacterium]